MNPAKLQIDSSGELLVFNKVTIGISHFNIGDFAFVAGENNITQGDWSTIGGGFQNQAMQTHTTVSGGVRNVAQSTSSSVGGGDTNHVAGAYARIGGGIRNQTNETYGTIAGGGWNIASQTAATVGGGKYNRARGTYSVVAGGGGATSADSNSASGDYSCISGGNRNIADTAYAVVGGGRYNRARGGFSVVAGGGGPNPLDSNLASGYSATVSGGARNHASGLTSTIAGGLSNSAAGWYASALGGIYNSAAGNASLAAGNNAKASHSGTVVIAANSSSLPSDSVYTSNSEQMILRADGGFYLTNTSGLAAAPASRFLNTSIGAYLSIGGTWVNASDRSEKENFTPVDRAKLLEKLSKLSITRWNYKDEEASTQHIGPMAQDFYALFGLGGDDKSISTIDPAGIALAAIQELYRVTQELENKATRIDHLERDMAELRQMVKQALARSTDNRTVDPAYSAVILDSKSSQAERR